MYIEKIQDFFCCTAAKDGSILLSFLHSKNLQTSKMPSTTQLETSCASFVYLLRSKYGKDQLKNFLILRPFFHSEKGFGSLFMLNCKFQDPTTTLSLHVNQQMIWYENRQINLTIIAMIRYQNQQNKQIVLSP